MADYDLTPGQMVGEYRIERKIGEGGFGKVYAAKHPVIGKAAAVKILNPDLAKNQEMVQRFADEARAVNQIRHRNIIDIFAFGTLPNGLHYFVMELLEGMSLDSYLEKNAPLDPGHALALLWPVGRALVAAHKAGIAHRDLKPENVFLTMDEDGAIFPKLLDFGIAKLLHESEMVHRTRTGVMMGTPLYMSPEQCRGSGVDHRSDIYSFGIMVHEVLTGGKPFMADTMMDLIIKQIGEPPPPMSSRRPDLPRSLDAAVLHMLEKAADRRPPTMQAALDELLAAARAGGIEVPASIHAPAHKPSPAATQPAQPPPSPGPAQPHVETGAWLQQSGAPAAPPGPGHTAPGPAPVAAHTPAPTAAGTGAGTPVPARASHPGHGAGYPAQTPSGGGGYPAHTASAGYPPGHGAGAGYPPGHAAGYPAGHSGATMQSAGHATPQPGPALAQPAPRKGAHPLAVFAALGAGLLFLFIVGVIGFVVVYGSEDTVEIGGDVPAPGAYFDRDTTLDLVMKYSAPGDSAPRLTIQSRMHRWQRITVRAVDGERVTRAEVQYGDHTETTNSSAEGQSSRSLVPVNRSFMAAPRGTEIEVTTMDGQPITEPELDEVVTDVEPLFFRAIDVFTHPLEVGETLRVPSDRMLDLLGFGEPAPGQTVRADNAILKLASVDPGGHKATFEVSFTYVLDGTSPPAHNQAALKGTVTLDTRTGLPVKGSLSGPLEGTVTDSGMQILVSGSMSVDSR